MTDPGIAAVPFGGVRRHARALAIGMALPLGVFFRVPDITPRSGDLPPVQLIHGRIIEVLDATSPSEPDVRIDVLEGIAGGPATGDVVAGFLEVSLYRHLGQPMAGQYDLVGVVPASVLAFGGLTVGAWGMQRRDVGR